MTPRWCFFAVAIVLAAGLSPKPNIFTDIDVGHGNGDGRLTRQEIIDAGWAHQGFHFKEEDKVQCSGAYC